MSSQTVPVHATVSSGLARIVIMGVAGSGKTTIGAALAERLGAAFVDADDLHPQRNIDQMRRGTPLTDDDRRPWLHSIGNVLATSSGIVVVACSALARRNRDLIRSHAPDVVFIYLHAPRGTLHYRLSTRKDHFMSVAMLDSQLADLEHLDPEERGIHVDACRSEAQIVSDVCSYLDAHAAVTG
jgi:beta-N-acetylhexosaminidase